VLDLNDLAAATAKQRRAFFRSVATHPRQFGLTLLKLRKSFYGGGSLVIHLRQFGRNWRLMLCLQGHTLSHTPKLHISRTVTSID